MDLSFAIAWARQARWHHALIADADDVLRSSHHVPGKSSAERTRRAIEQWQAHRDLHRQMLAEIESELPNSDLVVAHHRAQMSASPQEHAILTQEMMRRGIIARGSAKP